MKIVEILKFICEILKNVCKILKNVCEILKNVCKILKIVSKPLIIVCPKQPSGGPAPRLPFFPSLRGREGTHKTSRLYTTVTKGTQTIFDVIKS